ncbi:MAG TPA: hypothetical protein VF524_10155, partial [Polyangia bacterium]
MASLVADMQQMLEQYPLPQAVSREPTHWINATVLGALPSLGRCTWPLVGPAALSRRSNCGLVSTLAYRWCP